MIAIDIVKGGWYLALLNCQRTEANIMSSARAQILQHSRRTSSEYLPESDGKPMAETDFHRNLSVYLLDSLEEYYRDDPNTYVSGNMFLYYNDEFEARHSIAPDIFVVKGVEKKARRIYLLEQELKAPDFIMELISRDTKVEDLGNKRFIYASLGVREYFIFDPLSEVLETHLRGYRLEGREYMPLMGSRLTSEVLKLELIADKGFLRLFDHRTKTFLRSHRESEAAVRAAEQAFRVAEAARQGAEEKAKHEQTARLAAESEVKRLREELEKMKRSQ